MPLRNKIILSLRLNESVINEAEVKADGDFVVIVKKDGSEDRFKPVGLTAAEVVDKFASIKKHSEGRAWQWLRKVEREEQREAEIEDESTVTETPAEPVVEETPAPVAEPVVEEEDSTTECPYHNLLADLLNKENVTVQDYEAAIIKINEAPDIPEEKKARIIEILNHIKDEELEHVNEIQEADKILKGEDLPAEEPEGASAEEIVSVEENPEDPNSLDVSVEDEVEQFESIKEAVVPEDEVFKLLKGKEFDSYEDVEKHLTDEGFEVVEVFKEGDGFNINLRKEGVEYFVPFCACAGKFCATLEAKEDEKLEEGLGDWIAAKVGKLIGKGRGHDARNQLVKKIKDALGDAVEVVANDDAILVRPANGYLVSIGAKVDENGLSLGDFKSVDFNAKELADKVKDLIGKTDKEETPAEEQPAEGDEDLGDLDDETKGLVDKLKAAGFKISR